MAKRRSQQPSLFDTIPARIEMSFLQRAQALALVEVLLTEAMGEDRGTESAKQREVDHDENNC
jgi:hypothetical protein